MLTVASAGPGQPTYATDPAQLPVLLWQLVADPTITYLLGGHGAYARQGRPA